MLAMGREQRGTIVFLAIIRIISVSFEFTLLFSFAVRFFVREIFFRDLVHRELVLPSRVFSFSHVLNQLFKCQSRFLGVFF